MKYILCILFIPLLISCNKEKPELMISKEMLIGDYLGTIGKSDYRYYYIESEPVGNNYNLKLYDFINKIYTDGIWGLNIVNNKIIIPDQSVSFNVWDNNSNVYVTYYYNYNGLGELNNSTSTISFTIFKEVVRVNTIKSKDTLHIQLIKSEKVSEALIGKYTCTTPSQEYVQVEKASNSDSLIITINNANLNPLLNKFKIKPPDLRYNIAGKVIEALTNGYSTTQIGITKYFTLVTFGKNSLKLEISYGLYAGDVIHHSFNGNK